MARIPLPLLSCIPRPDEVGPGLLTSAIKRIEIPLKLAALRGEVNSFL
jgi:hypothetical protein